MDAVTKGELEVELKKSRKKLHKAQAKLARLNAEREKENNMIVGGPVGLRTSGVGIVRVGSAPRAVGDSTAVNRRRRGFRR
jgi:hypothetical protein